MTPTSIGEAIRAELRKTPGLTLWEIRARLPQWSPASVANTVVKLTQLGLIAPLRNARPRLYQIPPVGLQSRHGSALR